MSRFSKLGLAALALVIGVAGCAERAPRSFVQPNVLKKSDLDGTWYYIQTVTDAPVTSSFMFIGNSSELMKIRFDVQENTLFARRSYEQIQGTEDAYIQDPTKYLGQPLAAWPIKSQFDIIRDYNPTTGEETNRIIESTERAWNEREFIRVDWSTSQLGTDDLSGLGLNFFFEPGMAILPASWWESDPTKPDSLHLERADASDGDQFAAGEANYLDITNKWVITPGQTTINYEEGGVSSSFTAPTCLLSYKLDDCSSQVVKVRHAFAKLSPKHDFQPRNWDGNQMNLFGIWDVGLNRLTYNRQYGVTNTGFNRHAARFNLWEKSYGDDGTTPIPYAQRTVHTTPYYAESSSEVFPAELFDTGKEIIRQWNAAVQQAVTDVQGGVPTTSDVFVWCHNPVKLVGDSMSGADPAACKGNLKPDLDATGKPALDDAGNMIYHARQGDPRRSNIFWVNQQQNAGPLGYGPPLFDVETGETISGQAYIYGAAIDTYSARSRDLVKLLLGKLDSTTFVNGDDVASYVTDFRSGMANLPQATFSPAEIANKMAAMDFSWAKGQAPQNKLASGGSPKDFLASLASRENAMYAGGIFGSSNADLSQIRRDHLRDTQLEGMMITPDVMASAGGSAGSDWTSLSDDEKSRVSPIRSEAVRTRIEARLNNMRALGYDFDDFADEGMIQRAIQLATDPTIVNLDDEAVRQKLRKDIFLGVTLHEVGHNMGLRHNFRASWDSLNYFDEYWQLRDENSKDPAAQRFVGATLDATNTLQVTGAAYDTAGCATNPNPWTGKSKMRPRYVNCPGGATSVNEVKGYLPISKKQLGAGVREFQYSSIMDYGAEFNSDLQGLGKYDRAAMKFSYAGDGYVEVFTKADVNTGDNPYRWGVMEAYQNAFGFPSPIISWIGRPWDAVTYTTYPDLFTGGDITNITQREDVPYDQIQTNDTTGLRYYDGDNGQEPLVPFYFCSDEFVGNLTCARFDSGADAYEQSQDTISRYENFYLMNNFKRDRYTFHSSLAYETRIHDRYFDMMHSTMQWYTLLRADFEDGNDLGNFFTSETGWGNFTVAMDAGMNALGRVVTRPDAGTFTKVAAINSPDYNIDYYKQSSDSTGGSDTSAVYVPLLAGKYITTTWDFTNCGYYWADECQTRIGYFMDKTLALQTMADSQAYFTGRDTSTDVRKYAIGYITSYKNQLQERFGALFAGDYTSFAPRAYKSGTDPNAHVEQANWSDFVYPRTDGTASTAPSPGAVILDPAGGFTLQLYAGVYGLSNFPGTFDQSFIDNTKIFVLGNGEAPIPDDQIMTTAGTDGPLGTSDPTKLVANGGTFEWLYVKDSISGKNYAAHSAAPFTMSGVTKRVDASARMLETYYGLVNARDAACTATPGGTTCITKTNAVSLYKGNLDVMRSIHAAFGYGVYKTDTPFLY